MEVLDQPKKDEDLPMFKIIMIGESAVGKTSLVSVFARDNFPSNILPTIGIDITTKVIQLRDGTRLKSYVHDTAGQERYKSLTSSYCRKALGCLLVYDVTRRSTFETCSKYLEILRQTGEPDCVVLLVGNKVDITEKNQKARQVTQEEARQFASENKLVFIETSAFNRYKVNDAFIKLLELIVEEQKKNVNYNPKIERIDLSKRKPKNQSNSEDASSKGCC